MLMSTAQGRYWLACLTKYEEPNLTETFALVGGSVNENFGADDVSERQEHLHELCITKLLGKVIDKEITALGTGDGASWNIRNVS